MKKFKNIIFKIIGLLVIYNVFISITSLIIFSLISILERVNIISPNTYIYNFLSSIFLSDSIGLIVFLIYLKRHFNSSKESLYERCNFKTIRLSTIAYIIIFTLGVSIVLGIIIDPLAQYFPSYGEIEDIFSEKSSIALLNIVILGPIVEEIIFRGVIFDFLRKNLKLTTAVIIQAFAFGVFHMNLFQGMYAFIIGLILALVYLKVDSIYGSIIMHITCNALGGFILPFISDFLTSNLMNMLVLLFGVISLIFGGLKIFRINKSIIKNKFVVKL